jgi:hypothetical protein
VGRERAVSLFRGMAEESYWDVAPYLAKVDPELLEWIERSRWSEPWGIFAMAKCGLDELQKHFRRFLLVKLPDGKTWYFRYYDPRRLKTILETCTAHELAQILGPARGFAIGGPEPDAVQLLALSPSKSASPASAYSADLSVNGVEPVPRQVFPFCISRDLLNAMNDVQTQSFVERCKKYMEDRSLSVEGSMEEFIGRGIRYARSVGITSELDVVRFVHFFALPPASVSGEMVRSLLQDESITGTQKVDLLCELAAFGKGGD